MIQDSDILIYYEIHYLLQINKTKKGVFTGGNRLKREMVRQKNVGVRKDTSRLLPDEEIHIDIRLRAG